jgi:two-component system, NtrC family, sensor kinase
MDTQHLDPLLLPVFNSFNEIVRNLGELEAAKRMHAESLEAEVRAATQALLEQQRSLAQAERLAAVGEIAAGVAHELRNPLAGIQMSCVNLRSEIDNPDQVARLDLIVGELKRMARLLTQLLEQSKQAPTPSQPCDLATLVRELVALTRYQIPPQIELDYRVPDTLICRVPESSLRQVLLNLVLNAAQAIDAGPGKIWIEVSRDEDWLWLDVMDNGPGFPEELLRGVVRPFASGRSQGTGLGLAIVQRTMRESGGHMKLSNLDPTGACVTLKLPFKPD